MSIIYITNKSKTQFISNIHNKIRRQPCTYNKELVFVKKYKSVRILLLSTTNIIADLCNVIMNYINDVFVMTYDFEFAYDEVDYDYLFNIMIRSNDINIQYEKYQFSYCITIAYSMNDNLLHGKPTYKLMYSDAKNFYKIKHTHCREYNDTAYTQALITELDIIQLFNAYMQYIYGKTTYFGIPVYDDQYKFIYKQNKYVYANNSDEFNFTINNHKKLKNLIVIMKLIIDIVKCTIHEYESTSLSHYLVDVFKEDEMHFFYKLIITTK